MNEWGAIIRSMTNSDRRAFLSLALSNEGFSFLELPAVLGGLEEMLKPLLKAVGPQFDRYCFDAGYHRSTLLAMIDGDGSIIPPLNPSDAAKNVGYSDAFFHLLAIGNSLKDASPEDFKSLVLLLQAPVDELVQTEGPCSGWLDKPWFKTLVLASENQGKGFQGADLLSVDEVTKGTAASFLKAKERGLSDVEWLAWALILLRNILGHALLEDLLRSISIMNILPFAQPACLVVDRFSVILDEMAKKGPSGGARSISTGSYKGPMPARTAPAIAWHSRVGDHHCPKPPVIKRKLLGSPPVPHVRRLHQAPDMIKARNLSANLSSCLGTSLQRPMSRTAHCRSTGPRF